MSDDPEVWTFEVLPHTLAEIKAMSIIVELLGHLEDDEVARTLDWATARFRVMEDR